VSQEHPERFTRFDIQSPEVASDPYPLYAKLRAEEPVYWSDAGHLWLLTRYDDVFKALTDVRLSAQWIGSFLRELPAEVQAEVQPLARHFERWLLLSDPPEHTRRRMPANQAFTPRLVENWRPRIQAIVDHLLDQVADTGRMDVIEDFSYPLPVIVIAEMLGVPQADRDQFKAWSQDILAFIATDRPVPARARQAQHSLLEQTAYLKEIFAQRRQHPQGDLISALLDAERHGYALTDEERVAICVQLLLDGHETTTNLIGNAVLALMAHPDEFRRLRDNPSLLGTAVEEFLRYDGPVQLAVRVAAEDFELRGKHIRQGQLVWPMLGAANRDPSRFPEPDRLDLGRRNNQHVALGHGTHFCLGAPLARLEGHIAIGELVRRFPTLQLDIDPASLQWIQDPMLHGVISLPVVF
jgi:cytochrome P450